VLKEVIGDDPTFEPITSQFAITPAVMPLDDPAPVPGDARYALPGFPRPGDAFAVDAAGGVCRTGCGYGSGPVMRIVMELDPAGMKGVNVLPGGQSADPDSEHFADQAALWIANEAFPLRFSVDDVVANAARREVLHP
jgi:penicillin amidase